MSYTPTTWKAGDTVTSAKLNKMEQGIANGGGTFVITASVGLDSTSTLNKTWQEIYNAAETHQNIVLIYTSDSHIAYQYFLEIYVQSESYCVRFLERNGSELTTVEWTALSANAYPTFSFAVATEPREYF